MFYVVSTSNLSAHSFCFPHNKLETGMIPVSSLFFLQRDRSLKYACHNILYANYGIL